MWKDDFSYNIKDGLEEYMKLEIERLVIEIFKIEKVRNEED